MRIYSARSYFFPAANQRLVPNRAPQKNNGGKSAKSSTYFGNRSEDGRGGRMLRVSLFSKRDDHTVSLIFGFSTNQSFSIMDSWCCSGLPANRRLLNKFPSSLVTDYRCL
eukprot:gb/GECG01013202.1/.p1 GENE.gb/GECG01013202.1/~~gb/GECG01013202.1/.p1  ORF type:complete len:110 (+),score=7.33 gb/GECG01013202.1/:1-330(+)